MDRAAIRFVADVHIGNHKRLGGEVVAGINDRCRRILQVLEAATEGVRTLVVLGDLFDVSNPTPQVVAATMRALNAQASEVVLLLGNHDMVSTQLGDNALAVFDAMPQRPRSSPPTYAVIEQSQALRVDVPLYLLPFRPAPMAEWFGEAVARLHAQSKASEPVLCFHAGVRDHNTPRYLWSSPDAIDADLLFDVMRSCGSKLAVCGNWHNHRVWKRDDMTVVQVGALVPTGWDNPGLDYGHVVDVLDDGTVRIGKRLPGPRFLTLTAEEACVWTGAPADADGCYLRVSLPPGATDADAERLVEGLQGSNAVLALELVPAAEETAAQEAEAAEAARTADTLDGALREYVSAMPLPEGVERSAVEARVLNYMARE